MSSLVSPAALPFPSINITARARLHLSAPPGFTVHGSSDANCTQNSTSNKKNTRLRGLINADNIYFSCIASLQAHTFITTLSLGCNLDMLQLKPNQNLKQLTILPMPNVVVPDIM